MLLKRLLTIILSSLMCFSASPSYTRECESIQDHATNTDKLYRTGSGAIDGAYTATSASMWGWGIGLFITIVLVTGILHQSKAKRIASSTSSTTSDSDSS